MSEQQPRGSTVLWERAFEDGPPSSGVLGAAVNDTRETYKIRRWWKYGQPEIDLIKATLDVGIEDASTVIQGLIASHGETVQVTLDVFPIGVPKPEEVRINLMLERSVQG